MHAQKKLKKILARKEDNLIENKKQNKTKERQGQGEFNHSIQKECLNLNFYII